MITFPSVFQLRHVPFRLNQISMLLGATVLITACGSSGGGGDDTPPSTLSSSSASSIPTSSNGTSSSAAQSSSGSDLGGAGDLVKVDINLDLIHSVGGVSEFDRRKYITIHAAHNESDWENNATVNQSNGAANALGDDLATIFATENDVYFGRNTGNMAFTLRQLVEDPNRPGYALLNRPANAVNGDPEFASNLATIGDRARSRHTTGDPAVIALSSRNTDAIVAAQVHPYWPGGDSDPDNAVRHTSGNSALNWYFSTEDTAAKPFGSAVGEYMGEYLIAAFNRGPDDVVLPGQLRGAPKPKYLELMNEPIFDLIDGPVRFQGVPENEVPSVQRIFDYHKGVAAEIRKNPANNNVLLGGYTTAFPNYEVNNFNEWVERDQLFIDSVGEEMDFFSIHLYDFPNFGTSEQYRKGSHMEATMDMFERYSLQQLGEIKPWVISEYGSQLHGDFCTPWSQERDWRALKAINSMLMAFMERPNVIAKTIPFITVKAEWGRISNANGCPNFADGQTVPYYWRLMRQANEPATSTGEWVYTEMVKFYELWAEVKGTRVDTWSQDLDILVDAYVDDKTVYVIVNSLEFDNRMLDLSFLGGNGNTVSSVDIKHLYLEGTEASGTVMLAEESLTSLPDSFVLGTEATAIIKVTYDNTVETNGSSEETKYYATVDRQPIVANAEQSYTVPVSDLVASGHGEAILRLGVGRDHSLAVMPSSVTINGQLVAVSSDFDFRGYDQKRGGHGLPNGRDSFFGVLEIPVSYANLATSNDIKITFSQAGGHVSSVALQVFNMSREVVRSN